ncbi:MAG: S8 family serine peptidase [Proteobacteria bacterium]|nr:S8 family serine peptidase [Pseudomonadota bacterium]
MSVGPNADLGPGSSLEDLIYSDAYSGRLTVYFNESVLPVLESSSAADAVSAAKDVSASDDEIVAAIKDVIASEARQSPDTKDFLSTAGSIVMTRSVDAPMDVVKAQRMKLERLSGKKLTDWNLVFRVDAKKPDYAVQILRNLRGLPSVDKVYPELKPFPSSLLTTPDLTGLQGYLKPEATHGGVNAEAAWAAGITGQDVYVVDNEPGMNFDHEEFDLVKAELDDGGNFLYQPDCAPGFPYAIPNCESWIAHGTAVAGILIAQDNGHGVTGLAHDAYYVQGSMTDGAAGDLGVATDGIDSPTTDGDDDIEPGSIWILEVQLTGKFNTSGTCAGSVDDQYGCVPLELWPDVFGAIEQATAFGVTVIEGGGNGQMNLDNPDLYTGDWSFAHNLSYEDAGAVMVGASGGADEIMASAFTNYGSRFNAFSWGFGVVTTGYPYGEYAWNGTTPPIPPNDTTNTYFIDNFGGTSSAAAIVGGAAVLVQSYARQELGHRRYLMPLKMREILYSSGVAQVGGGGNIGKQPRIDVAMTLVDTFLASVSSSYPELAADEQLTESQMIALRAQGVGIICRQFDPINSDPSCPDSEIFPEGTKIAKHYDFDGDGRADLVQFSNGNWKVDLSSTGPAADGFGAWDVDVSFPVIPGLCGAWPYVEDMNSDGRADFVAYDKCAGTFYVALTDTDLTRNNLWHGWDWVLDYSAQWHDEMALDPDDADYSRPVIGNYYKSGYAKDGFNDIAIICSDGMVRIDYGDGTESSFAGFEKTAQLISNTQLSQAPGWAYLPFVGDFMENGTAVLGFKVPDSHADEGRMYLVPFDGNVFYPEYDAMDGTPFIFGGNDVVPFGGKFLYGYSPMISVKRSNGEWPITNDNYWSNLALIAPANIYGNAFCHPVTTDFDGDGILDRAVMCPNEWRIAYSGTEFSSLMSSDSARHITLNSLPHSLPGRSYAGGISYTYAQQLMNLYQAQHPGDPVPIMVDMVSVSTQ